MMLRSIFTHTYMVLLFLVAPIPLFLLSTVFVGNVRKTILFFLQRFSFSILLKIAGISYDLVDKKSELLSKRHQLVDNNHDKAAGSGLIPNEAGDSAGNAYLREKISSDESSSDPSPTGDHSNKTIINGSTLGGRGQLVISNHCSSFDIFLLLAIWPKPLVFLSKPEYFRIPGLATCMRIMGHVAIDRNSPRRAKKALALAALQLRQGIAVAVFPEGTRSVDGKMAKFHSSPLSVLKYAPKTSVQPLTLLGSENAQQKGSIRINPTKVKVVAHPPIHHALDWLEKPGGKKALTLHLEDIIRP